jgi:hypothetical protein
MLDAVFQGGHIAAQDAFGSFENRVPVIGVDNFEPEERIGVEILWLVPRDVEATHPVARVDRFALSTTNGVGVVGYGVEKLTIPPLTLLECPLEGLQVAWSLSVFRRGAAFDLRSPCHCLASFVPTHGCPSPDESSRTGRGYSNLVEFASIWTGSYPGGEGVGWNPFANRPSEGGGIPRRQRQWTRAKRVAAR